MYDHVCIVRTVLESIRAEVRRVGRVETGGALVGYESHTNALILTHASGPGPKSELSRTNVLIDGQYAQAFCTQLFDGSGGRLDYVGDWHRHVGWSLEASEQDLEAMLIIAQSQCCSSRYPVSTIYRLRPERLVAYVLKDKQLQRARVKWLDIDPHGQLVR
jgi:integrative and conjugative element protein (TIGR02256 family)